MPRQLVVRAITALNLAQNVRSRMGDEADLRALWRSYRTRPVHPIIINPDSKVIDGYRRINGAYLEGEQHVEVECLVVEGDPTPEQIAAIQFASSVHRADISLYDKCLFMIGYRDANPGKTLKALADEIDIDQTMPTKLIAFEKCIEPVKEQIKLGKIGLRDMVAIAALSPEEQPVLLGLKLGGASAEEIGRQSRKRRNVPTASSTERVKAISLPLGDKFVFAIKGPYLTLDVAIEKVEAVIAKLKEARKDGHTAKTIRAWIENKPPKKARNSVTS